MNDKKSDAGPGLIQCEVCLREIPRSEAHVAEAEDYIVHFCGLECYGKWVKDAEQEKGGGAKDEKGA